MSEATPRYELPFLIPGQAQKEFFHNEALTRIDAALHPCVEAAGAAAAPAQPEEGQAWIVGAGAGGAWAGQEGSLAIWTAGGWRFVAPREGMSVWNREAGHAIRWDGAGWSGGELAGSALLVGGVQVVSARQPAVPSPSGGTVIDVEARQAVAAIIATLMSHGLTE
ncbi:MAG: DUF2793 domain-containing protein [Allosphingosinicella sp.]